MASSRRDFLKFAALLSGATGIAGFAPESVERAVAIEPAAGSSFVDAEHIVILMQENRSFDHALGTLQGVRGFNDPRAIRQPDGNSAFVQTSAVTGKSYAPWRLDLRDTRITWMGSLPHTRESQVDAWNEGQHDGWLDAKKSGHKEWQHIPITMGHFTREDLPFYFALADAFTVCDQHYCSAMTSTSPNRSIFWTGAVRDRKPDARIYMRNEQLTRDRLGWKTYPERLSEAGISWKCYQNELATTSGLTPEEDRWLSNYDDNVLDYFGAYNVETAPFAPPLLERRLKAAQKEVERLSQLADAGRTKAAQTRLELAREYVATLKTKLAKSGDAGYKQLTAKQRALHDAAFTTNRDDPHFRSLEPLAVRVDGRDENVNVPKGDVLHQFRTDVASGKLPTVSWLVAPENFSDHPSAPWYGAWYVSEVLDILTKDPEVWKKTIFLLTYDENDGYFDHAPSFVAPDLKRPETGATSAGLEAELEYVYQSDELAQGVSSQAARSAPVGMGFRVPMIVASPWTRGGWVNSQLFDHTSTLQFIEQFLEKKHNKTVREENMSGWRRAVAGDLTSCFRSDARETPSLDYLDRDRHIGAIVSARDKALPTGYKELTAVDIAAINRNVRSATGMSHQEHGTRPACALPYELYAHGAVSDDGKQFELELRAGTGVFGLRSAGAPFNVYLRNLAKGRAMQAATYTVKAGDSLRPVFALDRFKGESFEIEVLGPNGFYRRFVGSLQDVPVGVVMHAPPGRKAGTLVVGLHNPAASARVVTLTDNSYGVAAITKKLAPGSKASMQLPLAASHQWYDFTIRAQNSKAFAHFAGRVENGNATRTDPLMGMM